MNIAIIPVPYSLDEPDVGMGRAPEALLEAGLTRPDAVVGCPTTRAVGGRPQGSSRRNSSASTS